MSCDIQWTNQGTRIYLAANRIELNLIELNWISILKIEVFPKFCQGSVLKLIQIGLVGCSQLC